MALARLLLPGRVAVGDVIKVRLLLFLVLKLGRVFSRSRLHTPGDARTNRPDECSPANRYGNK